MRAPPMPYRWTMNFTWWTGALRACLLLDERAEALALLKEACAEPVGRLLEQVGQVHVRELLVVEARVALVHAGQVEPRHRAADVDAGRVEAAVAQNRDWRLSGASDIDGVRKLTRFDLDADDHTDEGAFNLERAPDDRVRIEAPWA